VAKFNQFSSENLLISIAGHLILVAIMITSFSIVINRAKLVTPDRIQIIEIDLDKVVVSGDETKLYNVGAPEEKQEEKKSESAPKKEDVAPKKTEIKSTTLVEDETKEIKKEDSGSDQEKVNKDAPKKKRVIRVNREVLSLDRTMTVSVRDALRVAMTRCWIIDTARPDVADIRAVAHLKMRKNGTVQDLWFESQARAETDSAFAYVLETIKNAVDTCQPFRMLPANEFSTWQDIELTFYPTQGKVM
jgi:hypothetical protein